MVGSLSTSQLVSVVIVPLSIIMLVILRAASRPTRRGGEACAGGVDERVDAEMSDDPKRTLLVEEEYEGQRLDKFLTDAARSLPLAHPETDQGRARLGAGIVPSVQHRGACRAGLRSRRSSAAPASPSAEELPLQIVYQDCRRGRDRQPAGMVVHPAAGHASGTLVNALLHHITT